MIESRLTVGQGYNEDSTLLIKMARRVEVDQNPAHRPRHRSMHDRSPAKIFPWRARQLQVEQGCQVAGHRAALRQTPSTSTVRCEVKAAAPREQMGMKVQALLALLVAACWAGGPAIIDAVPLLCRGHASRLLTGAAATAAWLWQS